LATSPPPPLLTCALPIWALWPPTRAVGAHMAELGGGSIVNIGSMSGLIVNRPPLATGLQRLEGSGAPAHEIPRRGMGVAEHPRQDRKSTRRNSSHVSSSH